MNQRVPVEGVKAYGSAHLFDLEYHGQKRKTRREVLLERMDGLIPW